ncbi:MAG TPA: Na+/H+ antiporter NhaA [Bryobacteraceae bacterium]|nr:Na+/H+ antiporter NhaA [Bryobacteraceae bacterium]
MTEHHNYRNTRVERFVRPFQEFAHNQASGGILLLVCTVAALVWANSRWAASYVTLWHTPIGLTIGSFSINHDLHFWVNDLLMAVFFFVVGLEIKRELLAGELASPRQAALPILAALGGVVVPAAIYLMWNAGGPGSPGWGIPMATDIAFAIGVLALLGDRVPFGLKVFLTALAIVDDLAAVIVISVFYTTQLYLHAFLAAAGCVLVLLAINRMGVRSPLPYAAIGVVLWFAVLQSGVHATIAGVVLAFTVPSAVAIDSADFLQRGREALSMFEAASSSHKSVLNDESQQVALEALEDASEKIQSPLLRLEQSLHPWVTFVIMPVFALANAGVALTANAAANLGHPITFGVIAGLLFGKPIGIFGASWLAVRAGAASLPAGVRWQHIHGAGWLGGIGFTMSIFVAGLAFPDEAFLSLAKIGVLSASLLAGIVGSVLLLRSHS